MCLFTVEVFKKVDSQDFLIQVHAFWASNYNKFDANKKLILQFE